VIPARAASQFSQALALLAAGKTQDAELELKTLAVAFPDFPAPHVNLGLIELRSSRFADAEQEFKAALTASPQDVHALNGLGLVYRRTGRFQDAEKAYTDALAADPANLTANRNLAVLYDLYLQAPEKALPLYQKYQELSGGTDKQVAEWIKDASRRAGASQKPAEGSAP
jgi:Flp pilus assembly protein TadD